MKSIVEQGFNLNTKFPGSRRLILHVACDKSSVQMVEELLKLGADVNALTEGGFSPLHIAAQRGNTDIIYMLLKAGVMPDNPSEFGNSTTPLQEAAAKGHIAAIKLLMAAGANPDYKEKKFNYTAFNVAKKFGQDNAFIELIGYQKVFIHRVCLSLAEASKLFCKLFKQNTAPGQYFTNLCVISDQLDADQYFIELKTRLAQNYENVKNDVSIIRKPIIELMKQYNLDKAYDTKVKRELGLVSSIVVNPVSNQTSQSQIK